MIKFENDNDITIIEKTNDEKEADTNLEYANDDEEILPEFTIKEEEIDVETL